MSLLGTFYGRSETERQVLKWFLVTHVHTPSSWYVFPVCGVKAEAQAEAETRHLTSRDVRSFMMA